MNILLIILLFLGGCAACSQITSCAQIKDYPQCGWCPSQKKAFAMDPNNNNLPQSPASCSSNPSLGQWTTNFVDCACLTITKPEGIIGTVNCGWCPYYNRAFIGNDTGPFLDITCPASSASGQWISKARNVKCLSPQACEDLVDTDCGWCPSLKKAFLGNSDGPFDGITCPSTKEDGQWTYDIRDCKCLSAKTPDDIRKTVRCGWCPVYNKAFIGNDKGPLFGLVCPASSILGQWTFGEKNIKCLSVKTCTAIEDTDCGWCPSLKKAFIGKSTGPSDGITCTSTKEEGQWTYETRDCQCLALNDCGKIRSTVNCGWCTGENRAFIGDASGASYGIKCSGKWVWNINDCPTIPCPSHCLVCPSSTVCTTCVAGYYLFKVDNQCYNPCPTKTFPNGQYCSACPSNCNACSSETICTACASGYYLSQVDNQCYTACPIGTLRNGQYCIACPSHCNVCSSGTVCTVCSGGYYLSKGDNKCYNPCPTGTFQDGQYCDDCPSHCAVCSNANTCTTCIVGYFVRKIDGTCTSCPLHCNICSSETACTTCAPGYYLSQVDNQCYNSCPTGTYQNGQYCSTCPSNCNTCSSGTTCTTCTSGYYLSKVDNHCYTACPIGTLQSGQYCIACPSHCNICSSGAVCITCESAYYLWKGNNQCYNPCPTGTFQSGQYCEACPSNCYTCSSGAVCTACYGGYYLSKVDNQCYNPCPTRTFQNGQYCSTCPSNCNTCSSGTTCTTCTSGYYLSKVDNQCYTSCPIGTLQNGQYCIACPSHCNVCSSETVCTTCTSGYYLSKGDNQCYNTCPLATFQSEGYCISCPSDCNVCSSGTSCNTCSQGYYLSQVSNLCNSLSPFWLPLSLSIAGLAINLVISWKESRKHPFGMMKIHFIAANLVLFIAAAWNENFVKNAILVGFFYCFGLVTSQLWVCFLAHIDYHQELGTFEDRWLKIYPKASYVFGVSHGIIFLFTRVILSSGLDDFLFNSFYSYWIPTMILACFLITLRYYLGIIQSLRKRGSSVSCMIFFYPLVMILPLPYFFAARIGFSSTLSESVFRFVFCLQGFLNALLYGLYAWIHRVTREKCSNQSQVSGAGLSMYDLMEDAPKKPDIEIEEESKENHPEKRTFSDATYQKLAAANGQKLTDISYQKLANAKTIGFDLSNDHL